MNEPKARTHCVCGQRLLDEPLWGRWCWCGRTPTEPPIEWLREQDGRLLNAAPDLLAALEDIARLAGPVDEDGPGVLARIGRVARDAIAKARKPKEEK